MRAWLFTRLVGKFGDKLMTGSRDSKNTTSAPNDDCPTPKQERRSQVRAESVLSKIEDATYAILRRYDKSA